MAASALRRGVGTGRMRAGLALLAATLVVALVPGGQGTAQEAPPSARGITLACAPGEVPAAGFTDTAGTTHAESIECVAWYEVAQGTEGGRFAPGDGVTRGQMATFIAGVVAHLGVALPQNAPDAFADDDGSTHESNIDALVELDMISGHADGTFRPLRLVRRDQMASFIARAVRGAGIEVPSGAAQFSDTAGNTHEQNINGVAGLGLAAGKGDGTYGVDETVGRGQMASFLARTLDLGVERGKAHEGGAAVTLSKTEVKAGDTIPGTVRSHRTIQTLNADGCGIKGAVTVAADGSFSVTVPREQAEGTCTIAFQVSTLRERSMTDVDNAFLQVGSATSPATVSLVRPTAAAPTTVQERQPFTITFTTDRPGGYALAHRREGASSFTLFEGPEASGSTAAGSRTANVVAPIQDGRYDIEVRFSTDDGKQSRDEERRALVVTDPPGPQPANVVITDPTSESPEVTTGGANVAVTFTTDKGGTYVLKYKPAFPPGGDAFLPFPDGGATGSATAGTKTVAVTAPGAPGTYDLRLEFTTTAGQASADTQTGALIVTVPGVTAEQRCDPIDPALCMFPFPNDHFTVADPTSATGRRVNFNVLSMPRDGVDQSLSGPNEPSNGAGKPIDPTEWNRNDGYSPGNHAMTYVPNLDLHQTWGTTNEAHAGDPSTEATYFDYRDHIADVDRHLRPDAPIVVLDATTGQRHPFWSELDMNTSGPAGTPVEPSRTLLLRPAVNWEEGHRYIVALRNLKDAEGNVIEPGAAFKGYRDGTVPLTDGRRIKFEEIFTTLAAAGIGRDDLFLAWDFTVASERNLAERMLHIRDDAFARLLGDTDLADGIVQGTSPRFEVDSVTEGSDSGDDNIRARMGPYRDIEGRVFVPNYLDRPQEGYEILDQLPDEFPDFPVNPAPPLSRFYYGAAGPGAVLGKDALPQQNPTQPELEAKFRCRIPLGRSGPVMLGLYGHGLLGTRSQVGDIRSPGNHAFGGCGLDWIGMATEDAPTVASILGDVSNFPSLPDRSQQGFLNFLFAGRAMVHPDGFATDPAFQREDGTPLIRTATATETPLFYDGNSQGGILGAALMSVSVDAKRGILGVPGNNYSTLLNRSVDWEPLYGLAYYTAYQNKLEQQLGFGLLQMLWDRSEGNGYAHHTTTDPLDNTIPHEVMWQAAWSDHQVSNHAAEVSARTTGAPVMTPNLERPPGNHHWEKRWVLDGSLFSGTASYPYSGSALVYWDSGNTTPPNGNLPPEHNGDPHSHPRAELASSWQEAHFILTGQMADVCAGGPYLSRHHPTNNGTPSCLPPARAPGSP